MPELVVSNFGNWETRPISVGPTNSLMVAPRPSPEARVGKCYNNVMAAINQHGGEAVYGWALTDWGPHRISGSKTPPPLYRRWLNHVVWGDPQGKLWEVSPNTIIGEANSRHFLATEFIPEATATFEILSDDEWFTRPTRYFPERPEGIVVANFLTKAQLAATDEERNAWLGESLKAITAAGFRPREWKVEMIGRRTGSIWLIAE